MEYGDFNFGWFYHVQSSQQLMVNPVTQNKTWDATGTIIYEPLLTAANIWYHFACTRKNGYVQTFVNGKLHSSIPHNRKCFRHIGISAMIGNGITDHTAYPLRKDFDGLIRDFCIIKGKALWTENFTPPTTYLPDKI